MQESILTNDSLIDKTLNLLYVILGREFLPEKGRLYFSDTLNDNAGGFSDGTTYFTEPRLVANASKDEGPYKSKPDDESQQSFIPNTYLATSLHSRVYRGKKLEAPIESNCPRFEFTKQKPSEVPTLCH